MTSILRTDSYNPMGSPTPISFEKMIQTAGLGGLLPTVQQLGQGITQGGVFTPNDLNPYINVIPANPSSSGDLTPYTGEMPVLKQDNPIQGMSGITTPQTLPAASGGNNTFGQSSNGYSAAGSGNSGFGTATSGGGGGGGVFPLQGQYGIVKMANGGLAGIDRLASNAMFPQSQMDKTQYAVSSQMPTSAETIRADYDTPSNAYTGTVTKPLAKGGIAALRYDDGGKIDYNARAQALANDVYSRYGKNQNYDEQLNELNSIAAQDPAAFYRARMNLYGKQMGWQTGQNTGARNEVLQKELDTLMPGAKAAGLSDEEISSLVGSGANVGNMENQRRIAEEAAKGKGWVNQNIPGGWTTVAALAAAAAAPYAIGALAGEGALGAGALGAAEGAAAAEGAGALTTAELMGGAGGSFVPAGGASFSIVPEAAYGVAEGIGAGEVANMLPSLKDAYKAYSYGKKGLGVLNALSGAGASSRGASANSSEYGYNLPDSGSYGLDLGFQPNTYGNRGLGISDTYSPLLTNPIFLSKLSEFKYDNPTEMAAGGITNLGGYSDGGRLLRGPGDGMSDNIPASIGGKQPARLADGEFVIPADVVSHLGNGSTDAGAKQLYKMMDKIRQARTGNPKQGKQINPAKFLPKG